MASTYFELTDGAVLVGITITEVDINAESLEFDIAALLGKVVSDSSCKSVTCVGFFLSGII